MDDDDEYGTLGSDPALAAALALAETQAQAQQSSAQPSIRASSVRPSPSNASSAPTNPPPKEPIKQPVPQRVGRGGSSSVIVSPRQKGNPILSYIKNVPWEYGEMPADYVVGETTCALFLSLKYHKLHPDYIYQRIRNLGQRYKLRVLLILVDITEHADPLRELTKSGVVYNLTVILAWSSTEAGRYLETFKSYEHTPPTSIQEKVSSDFSTRMVEVLTQIRSVNKVDAVSLVTTFGSVRAALNARPEEITMIGGWGPNKVSHFEKAVREPFRVRKTAAVTASQRKRLERREREEVASAATNPDVARRLGIGREAPTTSAPSTGPDWVTLDDEDEDALAAVAEAEMALSAQRIVRERSGRPPTAAAAPEDPEVTTGIMGALAEMRKRKQ